VYHLNDAFMNQPGSLKLCLKRGALVCAANWPLILIQFTADAVFKTLLAVPVAGGSLLVVLLVGGSPADLLRLDPRNMLPALVGALLAHPLALAAFLLSLAVIVGGGSVLMFAVKGGTVTVMDVGEHSAGAIEHPPLRVHALRRAAQFSLETFMGGVRHLFRRYLRLGLLLTLAYAASVFAYLLVIVGPPGAPAMAGPLVVILASLALVIWIGAVNFFYVLSQVAIALDDCTVGEGVVRALRSVLAEPRLLGGILGAVLALMLMTMAASILAIAALGLIAFVPFAGLVALPLQLCAWLVRGIVFQFIGLTGLAAYVRALRRADAAGRTIRSA
jgi:hypothetical protein